MPLVSIVIPCYNQGRFLDDALRSVEGQSFRDFEIVIVNDGSTDPFTLAFFEKIKPETARIYHISNRGLAGARNFGISQSNGQFILPLDADDAIAPYYLEKAVPVLNRNPNTGIVYGRAEYFGSRSKKWGLPPYSLAEMLATNIIYCSALFRKTDWDRVGGFDAACHYGLEDYDFWLSIIELGRDVCQLEEIVFYYRQHAFNSMKSKMLKEGLDQEMMRHIRNKHRKLYVDNIDATLYVIDKQNKTIRRLSNRLDRTLRRKTRHLWLSFWHFFKQVRSRPPI